MGIWNTNCAMAMAYWFISLANRTSIEVRLVEHEFISTHKVTRTKELEPIKTHRAI